LRYLILLFDEKHGSITLFYQSLSKYVTSQHHNKIKLITGAECFWCKSSFCCERSTHLFNQPALAWVTLSIYCNWM